MTQPIRAEGSLSIRDFDATDEAAVVDLWQRAGVSRPWNDPRRDIARKSSFQPNWLLIADDAGCVVGTVMVGYDGHRGWVNYLAVCPEHQRRGIGTLLMQHAEQKLREIGCPKINLQIRCGNDSAVAFYRAIGFLADDVVCMGKRLVADSPIPS